MNLHFNEDYLLSESSLFKKHVSSHINFIDFDVIKKEMKKYTKENKGVIPKPLKDAATKLYQRPPEDVIDTLPSVGEVLRLSVVVGIPMAINPLYGAFTLLADRVIQKNVDQKFIGKYIGLYRMQLHNVEKQLDKTDDHNKRQELEKIKKDLEKGIDKLEDAKMDLTAHEYEDGSSTLKHFQENDIVDMALMQGYQVFSEQYAKCEALYPGKDYLNESMKEKATIAKSTVNRTERKMDKWFENSLQAIKTKFMGNKREDIIKNETGAPSLSRMIRKAALLGTAAAINPAMAAIGIVVGFAIRSRMTHVEKEKLLLELNNEKRMVEEKIKDADAQGDRTKKYELMRLQNKINLDIDRLKRYI